MNHLQDFRIFKNRYLAMRHGHSEAEARGLILTNEDHCVCQHGLTDEGRSEVRTTVGYAIGTGFLTRDTIIASCDFLRCVETTEILNGQILGSNLLPTGGYLTDRLRDRFYGTRDGSPGSYRSAVWEQDAMKPPVVTDGTEPIDKVLRRITRIAWELETRYTRKTIVLVSHDEPLRILQCAFQQRDPYEHMHIEPFASAEIREISLS